MKHLLLTTIAAVVLVGCGDPTVLLPEDGKSIYRAASASVSPTKSLIESSSDSSGGSRSRRASETIFCTMLSPFFS